MGTLVFQATLGGAINLIGPNTASTVNFTLPSADGSSGQALSTNGSGTLAFGTLGILGGGTGLTSTPANGALDIGNGTGFTRTTLTAGTNVTITNGAGSITIAASGGGASAATPTALGTVYGKQTTSGGTPFLTAYGYNAGLNTTGAGVIAIGVDAAKTNTTGSAMTAVGTYALQANTTGEYNSAYGYVSLYTNTTGQENNAFGFYALNKNTTGSQNNAYGSNALYANTTGANNTAFGSYALQANTTASENTAVGYQSSYSNSTGGFNVSMGAYSFYSNTTGASNVAIGHGALDANSTASENVAVGRNALGANTTGYANTTLGYAAGGGVTTGFRNVLIGWGAGDEATTLTTGNNNVMVGYRPCPSAAGGANQIVINTTTPAVGKGDSTGFITPNGGGVYQGNNSSSWSTTSDQRLKKNIVNNDVGLEKLTQIQVRNFEYRLPEEITELSSSDAIHKSGVQLGVIAQELQAILPDCVKQESTGVMSVDTDNLTWYLINAVKELKAEFDAYKLTHP